VVARGTDLADGVLDFGASSVGNGRASAAGPLSHGSVSPTLQTAAALEVRNACGATTERLAIPT
jgi:hypothetical protein